MNDRILVIGADGAIGRAIACSLEAYIGSNRVAAVGRSYMPKDIERADALVFAGWNRKGNQLMMADEVIDACVVALENGCQTVVVFSGGGVGGQPGRDVSPRYFAAKAALCAWVEYAAILYSPACIHAVAPGAVRSSMNPEATEGPNYVVGIVMWLLAEPRRHLSGRLLSAKRDSSEALCRTELPDDAYRLRRVVP